MVMAHSMGQLAATERVLKPPPPPITVAHQRRDISKNCSCKHEWDDKAEVSNMIKLITDVASTYSWRMYQNFLNLS
jgi:hypothetical protein